LAIERRGAAVETRRTLGALQCWPEALLRGQVIIRERIDDLVGAGVQAFDGTLMQILKMSGRVD
jgi:hypothetical protein